MCVCVCVCVVFVFCFVFVCLFVFKSVVDKSDEMVDDTTSMSGLYVPLSLSPVFTTSLKGVHPKKRTRDTDQLGGFVQGRTSLLYHLAAYTHSDKLQTDRQRQRVHVGSLCFTVCVSYSVTETQHVPRVQSCLRAAYATCVIILSYGGQNMELF